jgi:hypothetical protein
MSKKSMLAISRSSNERGLPITSSSSLIAERHLLMSSGASCIPIQPANPYLATRFAAAAVALFVDAEMLGNFLGLLANRLTGFPVGFEFPPPRCGNCIPKGRDVRFAPEMVITDNPDGYICPKCAKILLWYQLPSGGQVLDVP